MTKPQAAKLIREVYFNDWGGGKIDSKHEENDNGLLVAALYMLLLKKNKLLTKYDCDRFLAARKACEVSPGLHRRSPSNKKYCDSSDNRIGILMGAALCGTSLIAKQMVAYGSNNKWCYNDTNPSKFDITACPQPPDVGIYKVCAHISPSLLEVTWGWASFKISNTSWLSWMRCELLREVGFSWLPWIKRYPLESSVNSYLHEWGKQQPLTKHLAAWFREKNHPAVVLAEGIKI